MPTTNQESLASFMDDLQNAMAKFMVEFESDQVLMQMRNDPLLYDLKLARIKELIREEFPQKEQMMELALSSNQYKLKCDKLQNDIDKISREYALELENIDRECQQYMLLKESELKQLTKQHLQTQQALHQNKLKRETDIAKLVSQCNKLETDLAAASQTNADSLSALRKLTNQHKEAVKNYEQTLQQQQEAAQADVQRYQQLVNRMQKDMQLIKQSWSRKCGDIEDRLRSEHALEIVRCEEKMKQQLQKQIGNLKLGKDVVFRYNTEVEHKKVQLIQRKYIKQISQCQAEISRKEDMVSKLKKDLTNIQTEKENLQTELAVLKEEIQQSEERQSMVKEELEKQFEMSENVKRELRTIREELRTVREELELANTRNEKLKQDNKGLRIDIDKLRVQINCFQEQENEAKLNNKVNQNRAAALDKEIVSLGYQIHSLKQQLNFEKTNLHSAEQMTSEYRKSLKSLQDKNKQTLRRVARQHLQVQKVRKQCQLIKETCKYSCDMGRTQLGSMILSVSEYFQDFKEQMEQRNRAKITELLDEIESSTQKDKDAIEELSKTRDNLVMELKEAEKLFEKREEEHLKEKEQLLKQEQAKCERMLGEEADKLCRFQQQMQQELQAKRKQFQGRLVRAEKEAKKAMRTFTGKWDSELKRNHEEQLKRERKLRELSEHIQTICDECEQAKKNQEQAMEQARKHKRKYELLKEERDDKVVDLLKKLDNETKHKLVLEKELKEIRYTLMRTTSGSSYNIHSSNLNNFSFTDRQDKTDTKNLSTDREKELSQIRNMIAMTYKVVGQRQEYRAENDGTRINRKIL